MKTQAQDKKQIILGLFFIILIVYFTYLLIAKLWETFSSVDAKLAIGIIGASTTIIVSLISILVSKQLDRKAQVLSHLREKKVPIYEEIIDFIFRVTFAEKLEKKPISEQEMVEFVTKFTQELIIWGSDDMIDAFYQFRMESINNPDDQNPHKIIFVVENLLLAIRKDLGHKNKNMPKGKLLSLFVNDVQVS